MKHVLTKLFALVVCTALTGCASQNAYQGAFNSATALTNNQKAYQQSPDALFKVTKQTFIQQGFTVENADLKSGIIKAVRNLQDKEDVEISYNIHASADISEVGQNDTNVALSASQQTVLHRSTTTWWHLLWLLPIIPTGTEYQTLVIKEGTITEPAFYTDFFNTLTVAVTKHEQSVKAAAAKEEAKAEAARIVAAQLAAEKLAADKLESEKRAAEQAEQLRIATEIETKRVAAAEAEAKAAADAKAKADAVAAVEADKIKLAQIAAENEAAANEAQKSAVKTKKRSK